MIYLFIKLFIFIINLLFQYESQEITEKKVQLAKRTQDQLQEILKRKQSLTLNLKRALPASPGRSSSSSDVLSSHDLKSFQDACNRKLRIASALCLLPSDLPSSSDTTETFHTAAANSPELRSFFPEIDITEVKDTESNKIVEENKINNKEDSNEYKNQTAEKVQSPSLLPTISSNSTDNNIQISPNTKLKEEKEDEEIVIEKIHDKVLEKEVNSNIDEKREIFIKDDEIESQEVASIEMRIQENKEMKRLNEKINQQRMVVMKCLETSSPAKDDLNQQILVLQDLQRQQIELEVWLLKQEKRFQIRKGTSQTELPVNYGETESEDDSNWNLPSGSNQQESDRDTISDRMDEQTTNQSIIPRIPTTRGYSSVYLTVSTKFNIN